MTLEQISTFLGYALVFNIAVYAFTAATLLILRNWMAEFQARSFGIQPEDMRLLYVRFLSWHKQLIINFFFVPWLAVWFMG